MSGDRKSLREMVATECAFYILSAYTRGAVGADVVTEKREDYQLADAILKLIEKHKP